MISKDKRTFLNLEYIQGEEVYLEFYIEEDCKYLNLDEYNFTGSIKEDFNDTPIANFIFSESLFSSRNWVASISGGITISLTPQVYKYEIRMEHKTDGKPDSILYGTLNIKPTRLTA